MTMSKTTAPRGWPNLSEMGWLGWTRLGVGLAQGGLLYWLVRAARLHVWPAGAPSLYVPLLLIALFIPLMKISALGNLRTWTLIIWTSLATLILAGLGLHDVLRAEDGNGDKTDPSFPLLIFSAAGLFIAHALVTAGDQDRKLIASYGRYFDAAWKHIIQVALAIAFIGVFWLLYSLATSLFELIGVHLLERLREKPWFFIPVSTMVTSFALHITDVNAGIVRGLRNLGLTLLSWLLVMMTALIGAFLLALPFTGLSVLWAQQSATGLLLCAAASLVILINAAYQDGSSDQPLPGLMRYAGLVAVGALLPLTALAGYGLWLRIGPYGLTPDRVIASACLLVASAYALGYAISFRRPHAWLSSLPRTNLWVSGLILALLLALFTPLADPAHLAVHDQIARLDVGKIAPDKFDYDFLRFKSARYGRAALDQLAARTGGPNAAAIAANAKAALAKTYAYEPPKAATAEEIAQHLTVYPQGSALPAGFLDKAASEGWFQGCFTDNPSHCDAILLDVDGDAVPEVLVKGRSSLTINVFTARGGAWSRFGTIWFPDCAALDAALKAGKAKAVPSALRDIEIEGMRFRVDPEPQGCPDGSAPHRPASGGD
jgi:hypothetical protein